MRLWVGEIHYHLVFVFSLRSQPLLPRLQIAPLHFRLDVYAFTVQKMFECLSDHSFLRGTYIAFPQVLDSGD